MALNDYIKITHLSLHYLVYMHFIHIIIFPTILWCFNCPGSENQIGSENCGKVFASILDDFISVNRQGISPECQHYYLVLRLYL